MNQLSYDHHTTDFVLDDEDFVGFQALALELTGIELTPSKKEMLNTRFSRHLRTLGLSNYKDYLALVRSGNHSDKLIFIDTITTNLTYFFREPHHFEFLKTEVLPSFAENESISTPIRIWSAGCSSGQEPYSIAISVAEAKGSVHRPTRILCSDIDSNMVQQTGSGIYGERELRGLSPELSKRWFSKTSAGKFSVNKELKKMIIAKRLNLFDKWPIRPHVDIIFCRNTLIYFNIEMQSELIKNFAQIQKKGGVLFLGHSESLPQEVKYYRRISNTVYEKI